VVRDRPDAQRVLQPVPNQQVLGGHAVLLVGYFRLNNKWWGIVRNSWGTSFGVQGYVYMPLRWICDYSNCDDFWIVNQVEGPASLPPANRKKAA
jgi:C1A family cysteine protease